MMALTDLANPKTLALLVKHPDKLSLFVDLNLIFLVIKIAALLFLLAYLVIGFAAFIKMRRLEQWLMSLQRYNFPRYLLIHLILASIGWILALIIL